MAKVLIIEDDPSILNAYAFVLSKNHQVFLAEDAKKGLKLARAEEPEIILLDMLMPGVSGIELLHQLNLKALLPTTKLVVLSNIESPKIREEAKELGAERYLLKIDYTPYDIENVIAELMGQTDS